MFVGCVSCVEASACIRVWNKLTSTQVFIEVGRPRKVHAHASCKVVPRPHPHRQVRHCTAACNDKDSYV